MEEEQKPKPVKEKKKRSQGPKKERKPKGPRAQQQQPGLGPGMAAQFFSQSQHQQLHQQEGLVLGDTHASFTGRLAAQHLGVPPASLPFTTTHHAGMVSTSSSPSPPVRVHTTLPPKKSISPSRMAAFTDPQGHGHGHHAPPTLSLGPHRPWHYPFKGVLFIVLGMLDVLLASQLGLNA